MTSKIALKIPKKVIVKTKIASPTHAKTVSTHSPVRDTHPQPISKTQKITPTPKLPSPSYQNEPKNKGKKIISLSGGPSLSSTSLHLDSPSVSTAGSKVRADDGRKVSAYAAMCLDEESSVGERGGGGKARTDRGSNPYRHTLEDSDIESETDMGMRGTIGGVSGSNRVYSPSTSLLDLIMFETQHDLTEYLLPPVTTPVTPIPTPPQSAKRKVSINIGLQKPPLTRRKSLESVTKIKNEDEENLGSESVPTIKMKRARSLQGDGINYRVAATVGKDTENEKEKEKGKEGEKGDEKIKKINEVLPTVIPDLVPEPVETPEELRYVREII